MGWWGVALALALPWLAGTLWLRLLWSDPAPGRWPILIAYGYVLGVLGAAWLLGILGRLGLDLYSHAPLLLIAILTAIPARLLQRRHRPAHHSLDHRAAEQAGLWERAALILLLAWLGVRLAGLALEVWWHPLFPWDAWTTWGLRARVWSELGQLIPFSSPQDWLADTTETLQTIPAWSYPLTISLVAAWPTLAFGQWNETVANLPWLLCALALALGLYGQSRRWGASPLTALVFVWLLMSLPMLGTHVALAGYADLWLATLLGFAFMSFLHWVRAADEGQGLLALLAMMGCLSIKEEGAIWVVLFVPAMLACRLPGRLLGQLAAALGLLGIMLWIAISLGIEIPLSGSLERIALTHLPNFRIADLSNWRPIAHDLFLYGNWHILGYLLVLALGWSLVTAVRGHTAPWQRAPWRGCSAPCSPCMSCSSGPMPIVGRSRDTAPTGSCCTSPRL